MILVLEEVDLVDSVYNHKDYKPGAVSITEFEVDMRVIEQFRHIVFRYHGEDNWVYKDIKRTHGRKSIHHNNHPKI